MSARIYPDVCVLLALDFEQTLPFRKCELFKQSIQRSNINCFLLSTVKNVRNIIVEEVVEAGGNALRGLWHHLSMAKGAGVPYILENAILTEEDLAGIKDFFRKKMQMQQRDLSKDQIQIQEVWAIDMFRTLETSYNGRVPLIEYLKRLTVRHNDSYVEIKNGILRTEQALNLLDEDHVNPNSVKINDLKKALQAVGFDDDEDLDHIASLKWLKQSKGYIPVFATADRELYECKDIIYEHTGVIVEDALYAVSTYHAILKKPWPVRRA